MQSTSPRLVYKATQIAAPNKGNGAIVTFEVYGLSEEPFELKVDVPRPKDGSDDQFVADGRKRLYDWCRALVRHAERKQDGGIAEGLRSQSQQDSAE